ncbi:MULTISPECIES: hypothetical protein [Gammaproteobacteria]|uniref:hypothetical protein n=1 Tax=Gammaproteobacteria TaxID=1236 RepID=UPI000DD022D5|nr:MULTISPECIES: hypothetical protein [Gammaproteobacteria]RTE87043.1 hypothetical protein DQX04_01240 [Aliidiomarina sp. B3213]TCZ93167.1 hypothetical protein EYQ95_04060 [Lysobacter sp. N42]
MEQLSKHPDKWQKKITLYSPITGKSSPVTNIKSSALNLGAFGVGVALQPGNQKVMLLPGWSCHHHSADLRDWFLTIKVDGAVLRSHLRLWPHELIMPFASTVSTSPKINDKPLFTIAPLHFQPSQKCMVSFTIPQHDKLSFLPHFGNVTAGDSPLIDLFLGAEFDEDVGYSQEMQNENN